MKSENASELVHKAIAEELKHGNELYGPFHSNHEAWAVLLEECDEIETEFFKYQKSVSVAMEKLWEHVKKDLITDKSSENLLLDVKNVALAVLFECVQVCAMCDKWFDYLKKDGA